jgi:ABC-2 type transport system ATP-binding protein
VFLSSHILSEVEALCDRLSIIRQGRNVETGTLAEMRHVTHTSVDVTLTSAPPALDALPWISAAEIDGNRLRCEVPTEQIGALLTELGPYGITTLTCQPPTLEQLFLRHYDRSATVSESASASTARS